MRNIGVVTAGRSDYGLYLPLLKKMSSHSDLKLLLYVTGMHLSSEYGNTLEEIKKDGFPITAKVDMLLSSDSPGGISKSMGIGTLGFAHVFEEHRPDLLVVLGDRFEMHSAAVAAVPFNIPIAHIHGGELTYGAFDNEFRHSLTKLCHLHFAATEEYAKRIIQMGEEPWRVVMTGALGLDALSEMSFLSKTELERHYGIHFSKSILLVTFHPVTREYEKMEDYSVNLLKALEAFPDFNIVFTSPNADTGHKSIVQKIKEFIEGHPNTFFVPNFGPQGYVSMMAHTAAMIGNSSSGIIEAASFKLPVVNIGTRQEGRLRNKNVIDVEYSFKAIRNGIARAISKEFLTSIQDVVNSYGNGRASDKMISVLSQVNLQEVCSKRFMSV